MKQLQLKLVDNWQQAWRFYSMHALLTCFAIGAFITALSVVHVAIPGWVIGPLLVAAAFSGVVGRIVKQDPADAQRIENLKK